MCLRQWHFSKHCKHGSSEISHKTDIHYQENFVYFLTKMFAFIRSIIIIMYLHYHVKHLLMVLHHICSILLGPGVHYNGHFSWCLESLCPMYWTWFNYHHFNVINIQIIITLKIMFISLRISYNFYLEFEDEFKSFVKFGLSALYNKLEI